MIARFVILLSLISCVGCRTMRAQNMREVDGVKYIEHTVQKGQTLFAISAHYAVPIDAITTANPAATQGISIGQVLLIPVKAQVKKDLKTAPGLLNGELSHIVKKNETLFGIAKKYGVDQNDLVTRNPTLADGVKEGMIVVIPVNKVTTTTPEAIDPAMDDHSVSHLVQPGETIYSLAKQFNLKPDVIQAANGGLLSGLKVGMYVRIPPKTEEPEPVKVAPVKPANNYQVALLLPFSITANDSARAHSVPNEDHGYYAATNAAVQFYAGATMAIDSLKAQGLGADIHVYDVGDDAYTWDPVLRDNTMHNMDLIIGPFHRAAIEKLAKVAPTAHIVCPVPQSNKVLLGNPTVSKVLSGRPDQLQQLARYVAYHHVHDNIIVCRPDIAGEKETQDQVLRLLQDAIAPMTGKLRDSVLVVKSGRRDAGDLANKLDATHQNVVLVPSEDVEFVSAVVNKLAEEVPGKRIVVYGLAGWADLTNIDPVKLSSLGTRIPASSFIDYNDQRTRHFILQYRDRFHNEPSEYAFLGFDVAYFYLTALKQNGHAFPEHFADVRTEPLHMAFKFFKAGEENGYRNENAVMLEFKDGALHRAP